MADLLGLESASPPLQNLPYPSTFVSLLHAGAWDRALRSLPDREFADFIMREVTTGFRIGIREERHLRSATRNLKSAADNPQVISTYLEREAALGRLHHIHPVPSSPAIHVSPCGAIPKKHKPGKWRLIVDLSSPEGHSVNNAIPQELCSVTYASLDQAVAMTQPLGKGCLLAKPDLREAYRAVPVHPSDQRLLAVQWKVRHTSIGPCHSAFGRHRNSSQPSQMPLCGSSTNGVSGQLSTTWTIFSCWAPQTQHRVGRLCQRLWPSVRS